MEQDGCFGRSQLVAQLLQILPLMPQSNRYCFNYLYLSCLLTLVSMAAVDLHTGHLGHMACSRNNETAVRFCHESRAASYLQQVCCPLVDILPRLLDLVGGLHVLVEDLLCHRHQRWVSYPPATESIDLLESSFGSYRQMFSVL